MKFKKLLVFVFILFFSFPASVFGQQEFTNNIVVFYTVSDTGSTTVTYNISLVNTTSEYYAAGYGLTLVGTKPLNPRAYQADRQLSLETETSDQKTNLKVKFEDSVVGKGNARNFSIVFEDNTIATKTGEVWEITIPRLSSVQEFNNYQVKIVVPKSLGELAYISPDSGNTESYADKNIYTFDKQTVSKTGVTAAFGRFQVFEFDITYHLENPLNKTGVVEVAIPPDTAYQKVNYKYITPEPQTVSIDKDGNWLALYKLKPRERVDIRAVGVVQLFAGARYSVKLPNDIRQENLKTTDMWQVNSPIVQNAAKNLKNPQDVYNFVVNTLNYDYERVKPNVARLGAEKALENPQNAICMEFTDTFIVLSRAIGIPAREINGYAYTESPEIRPLSLVADVLHAWPEYWDDQRSVWVPVDPTWGDTTGGADYFSKLDLRHFTFVAHGVDPYKPYPPGSYKLGTTPQKDIFVNFGKLQEKRSSTPQIIAKTVSKIPIFVTDVEAIIKNPGPTSIENQEVIIYFDNKKVLTQKIEILPPFASVTVKEQIPFSLLGSKTPSQIEIAYGGQAITLPTQKTTVIITNLVVILIAIFSLILYLFLKAKKHEGFTTLFGFKTKSDKNPK
ncbi:MAG: transglutaminase domain-containing protein [Patescibacteria group bacterium]